MIWGSTKSMKSETLCTTLHSYIGSTLGPFIAYLTMYAWQCSVDQCNEHGQCIFKDIPAKLNYLDGSYREQKVHTLYIIIII